MEGGGEGGYGLWDPPYADRSGATHTGPVLKRDSGILIS